MNCKKCNKTIPSDAVYCPYCAAKQTAEQKPKKRGNGQGYVYKRGDKYVAQVTLGYDGEKRRTASKTFTKKSDAIRALPTLKDSKFVLISREATFSEAFEKAMAHQSKRASQNTIEGYRYAFNHFSGISFRKLADIKTAHLQQCVDAVPGTRTKQMMRTAAGIVYKWALQNDIVDKNYAEYIIFKSEAPAEREVFTQEEIRKIVDAVNTVQYAEHLLALILTGCRPSELFALKKTDYHETYFVGGSKTEAGKNRIIPIHPALRPIVERLMQSESEYIFPTRNGAQFTAHYFRRVIADTCKQIGVRQLSPYCCRHTFATLIKDAPGANADKSRLMGHTKYSMTAHYTHADVESLSDIVSAITLC